MAGEQPRAFFVLTTGRTGSTFLFKLLHKYFPEEVIRREPPPSFLLNVYSNLRMEGWPIPEAWLAKLVRGYFLKIKRRLGDKSLANWYLEVNPFLYGTGDLIRDVFGSWKLIHMVRHPFSYAHSTQNYRPRAWRKFFVHAPLWYLYVSRVLPEEKIRWSSLLHREKSAWQWRVINQKIESYRNLCDGYLRVRYEDFFSSSPAVREETLRSLLRFLELPEDRIPADAVPYHRKENPSQHARVPTPEKWDPTLRDSIARICAPLMERYGYDPREFS